MAALLIYMSKGWSPKRTSIAAVGVCGSC